MRPSLAVAAEALKERMKKTQARAKGGDRRAKRISLEEKFKKQTEKAGYEPIFQFCGGVLRPAVTVPEGQLQDVIRATTCRVEWTWMSLRRVKVWPIGQKER